MSYVVSRHGSDLLVAAQAVDERTITHALDRLMPGLFLDVDHNERWQCMEYKVRLRYSRSDPPVFVTSWRDDNNRPLPLSSALVEHVKMLIETDTLAQAEEHNRALRERSFREMGDEVEEIARDMVPHILGQKSTILHRGVGLRRARGRTGRGQ